ncbi:MAG TPA: hypothetical protein PKV21_01335 [bacterium]|nr:hypothetical protein [bacterium]HOM26132.1 hypothetical protein [bacterium]
MPSGTLIIVFHTENIEIPYIKIEENHGLRIDVKMPIIDNITSPEYQELFIKIFNIALENLNIKKEVFYEEGLN